MATPQTQDISLDIIRYEYGDKGRKQVAVLQIETSKYYNGGLISDANVFWIGRGCRQSAMSMLGDGGDYRKRLKVTDRTVKATQKAIDRQHAEVFTADVVAGLVKAAKAHYAAVVQAGIDGMQNTYPAPDTQVSNA